MRQNRVMTIEPDRKDWTWVLERPCPECGFDAGSVEPTDLPGRLRATGTSWRDVLARDDASVRPAADVWSPLEYACHVRDLHRVFDGRTALMLDEDDPTFPDWDQDAAAVRGRYDEQDPATVAGELVAAGQEVAERYAAVADHAVGAQRPAQQRVGVHGGLPRAVPPARRGPPPVRRRRSRDPDVGSALCGTRSSGNGWSGRSGRRPTPGTGPTSR